MLREAGGTRAFRYYRVLLIVIESGMIYSVALICEITLYFLSSNAFYIVYDPIAQLTVCLLSILMQMCVLTAPLQAITPTMILILAGLELTSNDVHSRLTKVSRPTIRAPDSSDGTKTKTMDRMEFASRSLFSDKSQIQTSEYTSTLDSDNQIDQKGKSMLIPNV